MTNQNVTMNEARDTINHLVQGVDPYTGAQLGEVSPLKNPRVIGCFTLMSEVLTKIIDRQSSRQSPKRDKFHLTEKQASVIKFPSGTVGVKGIISAVNEAIDTEVMTGLTIVSLYKKLKDLGILEKSTEGSTARTVTTAIASDYGIETVKHSFQGQEYDRIMYTDQAKEYLRKELPLWYC